MKKYSPETSKLPRNYLAILKQIGESCAQRMQMFLKQYLRLNFSVTIDDVNSIIFENFINSIEPNSCIQIIKSPSFQHYSIFMQNIETISAIMERVLGSQDLTKVAIIEFTSIDVKIIEHITISLLKEIQKAFQEIIKISWQIYRQENNPTLASVLPDKEDVVIFKFLISGDLPSGVFSLCIHSLDLLGYLEKYKKNKTVAESTKKESAILKQLIKIPLKLSVNIGKAKITYQDIKNLREGDIIKLDNPANKGFLFIENSCKFEGKIGAVNENWAFFIEKNYGDKNGR